MMILTPGVFTLFYFAFWVSYLLSPPVCLFNSIFNSIIWSYVTVLLNGILFHSVALAVECARVWQTDRQNRIH